MDGRNNRNSPVAAGIYLCRLKTKDQFKVRKMVLLDGGSNSVAYNGVKTTKSNSIQKRLNTSSIFYFSIKVSGNEILTSDFKYLNCSSDTTLNLIVPKILQSATIGPGGGKLETEDFSLIVPEEAFDETVTLKLGIDRDTVSFENETCSKLFRVDGLPEFYFKDLSLKIKLHTQSNDSISFAVGGIDTIFFTEEEFINYDYYSAIDSSGYAVVNLPSPLKNNLGLLKLDNSLSVTNSSKYRKYFIVLTSPGVVLSSNGNFIIYFPKSKAAFILKLMNI